jgi:hypothetical protein
VGKGPERIHYRPTIIKKRVTDLNSLDFTAVCGASHTSLSPMHGHDITPFRESEAEFSNASFLRQLEHKVAWNQIAKPPGTAEF